MVRSKPHRDTTFNAETLAANGDPFEAAGSVSLSPRMAEILLFVGTHYAPGPFAVSPQSSAMIMPRLEASALAGIFSILSAERQQTCTQAYLYACTIGMGV